MRKFDAKWQICSARARKQPRPDESAPLGFASRVLAAARSQSRPASLEQVWQQLAWSSLALAAVLLLVCALIEMPHLGKRKPLDPGIENTVAQLVWSL